MAKPKRPRDPNQLGKLIVDLATREAAEVAEPSEPVDDGSDLRKAAFRRGGLRGGKARAAKLTPEQRSEIARKRHVPAGELLRALPINEIEDCMRRREPTLTSVIRPTRLWFG
jgi:hypothetical protein